MERRWRCAGASIAESAFEAVVLSLWLQGCPVEASRRPLARREDGRACGESLGGGEGCTKMGLPSTCSSFTLSIFGCLNSPCVFATFAGDCFLGARTQKVKSDKPSRGSQE